MVECLPYTPEDTQVQTLAPTLTGFGQAVSGVETRGSLGLDISLDPGPVEIVSEVNKVEADIPHPPGFWMCICTCIHTHMTHMSEHIHM